MCKEKLGDRVKFQLGPNTMTIQSAKSTIRSKTVVWAWHQPKKEQAGFSAVARFGAGTNEFVFNNPEEFTEEQGQWIVKGIEAFEEGKSTLVNL